ncbi:MAG: hypothetical protein AAGI72_15385 [Pseudomonadota bacterium]
MIDDVVPTPTGKCRCGAPVALRLVCLRHHQSGHTKLAPFSEHGTVKYEDRRTVWESARITGEWRFEYWHETCAACFYGESGQQEAFAA